MTRLHQISPFCQLFGCFGQFSRVYLGFWQNFAPTLVKKLFNWANFLCCQWPKYFPSNLAISSHWPTLTYGASQVSLSSKYIKLWFKLKMKHIKGILKAIACLFSQRWLSFHFSQPSLIGFFFTKIRPIPASFVYFRLFHTTQFKIQIDGVLGTRTQGGGMEGADQSTEL